MNKNIAINVLTWNDWKNTIVCLESILHSEYDNFDIILIDNNSNQSHLEKIYQWSENKIKVSDQEFNFNANKQIDIKELNSSSKISKIGKREIYLIKNQTNLGLTAGLNVDINLVSSKIMIILQELIVTLSFQKLFKNYD